MPCRFGRPFVCRGGSESTRPSRVTRSASRTRPYEPPSLVFFFSTSRQHRQEIPRHSTQHADQLHHRGLQEEQQLRVQLGLARQVGQFGHFPRLDGPALHDRGLDGHGRRRLGKRRQRLGQRHRVVGGVGHRRRPLEVLGERLERRAREGALGQRVLDDLVLRLGGAQLPAQFGDLRDVEPLVVHQDRGFDPGERLGQRFKLRFLGCSCDSHCS